MQGTQAMYNICIEIKPKRRWSTLDNHCHNHLAILKAQGSLSASQYDNTLFCLPYFHVSNSSSDFTYYFSTVILHKHSLDTFYINANFAHSLSSAKSLSYWKLITRVRQWTRSSIIQVMACRLFGTKPLPGPVMKYRQLDPCEQNWLIYNC